MVSKELLTIKQMWWLLTRGGRNNSDVFKNEKGFYVLMSAPGGGNKVYIPEDKYIEEAVDKYVNIRG